MKQISFINQDYNLPESWQDISLKNLLLINQLKDEDKTWSNIIEILTGIKKENLRNANVDDVEALKEMLLFTNELPEFKPIFNFEFDNKKWCLNENIFELSYGQFEDCMTYEKQFEKDELKRITYIISVVLALESQQEYDSKLNEARAKLFEALPCTIAYGIANFFLSVHKLSIKNMNDYLIQKEIQQNLKQVMPSSHDIGRDMLRHTLWQKTKIFFKDFMAKKKT